MNFYETDTDSMNLTFNLDEVDESEGVFEALKPGWYEVEVGNCEYRLSKAGSPMLQFEYTVIEETDYKGRKLFDFAIVGMPSNTSELSSKKIQGLEKAVKMGRGKLKRFIKYTGIDIPEPSKFTPESFADSGIAVGAKLQVKVTVRMYQGEKTNSIKDMKEASDAGAFF